MKVLGGLLCLFFWGLALICGFGVIFYEFLVGRTVTYQKVLGDPGLLGQAHHDWYVDTLFLGATLVFTGIGYLFYVKWLQPIPEQERLVTGLKDGRG